MIVLDASVAVGWYLEDEAAPATDALMEVVILEGGMAPLTWPLEVANALRAAFRRGRISRTYRDGVLEDMERYGVVLDPETNQHAWTLSTAISDRHQLTLYDAAYLELAIRHRIPLATTDKALVAAARAEGVYVLPS